VIAANTALQSHTPTYLGGCGTAALPRLLQHCTKALLHCPTTKFHLLVFAADDTENKANTHLQALLEQLQPFKHLPLVQAMLQQPLLPIEMCQRLLLDAGRVTIDLYLGCNKNLLKTIMAPCPWITLWYWQAPFTPTTPFIWQLARFSCDNCVIHFPDEQFATLKPHFITAGFQCQSSTEMTKVNDDIALAERQALRHEALTQNYPYPRYCQPALDGESPVAIIGAGIAGASLALSLAERGIHSQIFYADSDVGVAASGNWQGALYPQFIPEANTLNAFFQQGFLFSRQRIEQLVAYGHDIPHDFCGVLLTGFDQHSRARLEKIAAAYPWANEFLQWLAVDAANAVAGVNVNEPGLFYPLAGWVGPQKFTQAAVAQAQQCGYAQTRANTQIVKLTPNADKWQLSDAQGNNYGPYTSVIIANGSALIDYPQTAQLPATRFRGQVSEVPTQPGLAEVNTVLCARGYLTPVWEHIHCLGASYVKDSQSLSYSENEQQENLEKLQQSYPDTSWHRHLKMGQQARVGVRMVTRDHLPMAGAVPDVTAIYSQDKVIHDIDFWRKTKAPLHQGLYVLGALGSRGLCSAPLAAEMLAAELTHQPLPLSVTELEHLSPNRKWMRKLLKGKEL